MIERVGKRIVLLMVVAAAAAGLVACGSDSGDDEPSQGNDAQQEELSNQRYAEELTETMIGLSAALQAIDSATAPEDLDLSRQEFKALGEQVRDTVDEFGAIDPPGDAQEGHDRILAALEDFSSKYTDVVEAIESEGKPSEETFTALRTAIFELQDQYLQAREILVDAGIELGTSQAGS